MDALNHTDTFNQTHIILFDMNRLAYFFLEILFFNDFMTLQYSNKSLIRALSLDLNLADMLMAVKPDFNIKGFTCSEVNALLCSDPTMLVLTTFNFL